MSGKAAGPRTKSEDEVASAADENEDVSVVEMGWGGVSESLRTMWRECCRRRIGETTRP